MVKTHWVHLNQVKGALAMWAVRQTPYVVPDDLAIVIEKFVGLVSARFDTHKIGNVSHVGLVSAFHLLYGIPEFRSWNERKNGDSRPYQFVSRYDGATNPDDDFIDLDALIRNCVIEVWRECERDSIHDRAGWNARVRSWIRYRFSSRKPTQKPC